MPKVPHIDSNAVRSYVLKAHGAEGVEWDAGTFDSFFGHLQKVATPEQKRNFLLAAARGHISESVGPGTRVPFWTPRAVRVLAEINRTLCSSHEHGQETTAEDLIEGLSTHLESEGRTKSVSAAWAAV